MINEAFMLLLLLEGFLAGTIHQNSTKECNRTRRSQHRRRKEMSRRSRRGTPVDASRKKTANFVKKRVSRRSMVVKRERKSQMQIFVKMMTGKTIALDIAKGHTIAQIKASLYDIFSIPSDQLRLFFRGKPLDEDKTTEYYHLTQQCTIHVTLRLKGGMPPKGSQRAVDAHGANILHPVTGRQLWLTPPPETQDVVPSTTITSPSTTTAPNSTASPRPDPARRVREEGPPMSGYFSPLIYTAEGLQHPGTEVARLAVTPAIFDAAVAALRGSPGWGTYQPEHDATNHVSAAAQNAIIGMEYFNTSEPMGVFLEACRRHANGISDDTGPSRPQRQSDQTDAAARQRLAELQLELEITQKTRSRLLVIY